MFDARRLVVKIKGPLGTVYKCPFCRFVIMVRPGGQGTGRGYGLRNGGAAHAHVVGHINKEHPEQLGRVEE